jgi:signal transduction histidine kinase
MAKDILEKNGGRLSIKSELGKGTSFVINLPNI